MMRFLWSIDSLSCTDQKWCCKQWKPGGSENKGMFIGRALFTVVQVVPWARLQLRGWVEAETRPELHLAKPCALLWVCDLQEGEVPYLRYIKTLYGWEVVYRDCHMGPRWVIHEAAHGSIVLGGGKVEALKVPILGNGESKCGGSMDGVSVAVRESGPDVHIVYG